MYFLIVCYDTWLLAINQNFDDYCIGSIIFLILLIIAYSSFNERHFPNILLIWTYSQKNISKNGGWNKIWANFGYLNKNFTKNSKFVPFLDFTMLYHEN